MPNLTSPIIAPLGSTTTYNMFHQANIASYNSDCSSRLMTITGVSGVSWAAESGKTLTLTPLTVGLLETITVTYAHWLTGATLSY